MHLFKPSAYIDYTPPKLTTGKLWYISFYVKDPVSGKLKRQRIKVNREKKIMDRRRAAMSIISALNERLAMGWNPLIEAIAPKAYAKMFDVLDTFLSVKTKELEKDSIRSYSAYIRFFRLWIADRGFSELTAVSAFTKAAAIDFMSDLEEDDGISPRTYNNYLTFMKTLFTWMKDKGYIDENPFSSIEKKAKRLTQKTRRTFTDDELSRLFSYLSANNRPFLAICMICYYCLIRPKEIALLRCKDIDLDRQVIHISAEIAKNDNESFRTVPNALKSVLGMIDLSNSEYYVFAQNSAFDFKPGKIKVDPRRFSAYWSHHIRPACGFDKDLQLYSLKDTGITNMLNAGVPINIVQQQADHSSVAMTAIYVGKSSIANSQLKDIDLPE